MTAITRTEAATIRNHLGHGQGNRRVVVKADGEVRYTGSTDDYDRSKDGKWFSGGWAEDILADARRDN
jgi:hypothetical protein